MPISALHKEGGASWHDASGGETFGESGAGHPALRRTRPAARGLPASPTAAGFADECQNPCPKGGGRLQAGGVGREAIGKAGAGHPALRRTRPDAGVPPARPAAAGFANDCKSAPHRAGEERAGTRRQMGSHWKSWRGAWWAMHVENPPITRKRTQPNTLPFNEIE